MKTKNSCVVFFTKIPALGFGKSRLVGILNKEQVCKIAKYLVQKNFDVVSNVCNLIVYYDGAKNNAGDLFACKKDIILKKQIGTNLAERMLEAFKIELQNFEKVILLGSDFANLNFQMIQNSLVALDENEISLTPTADGGYGIIGMRKPYDVFTSVEQSTDSVLENTKLAAKKLGASVKILDDELYDIDTFEDLICYQAGWSRDDCKLLGAGEYNLNYFNTNEKKVFRINIKSQLDLGDKQIEYEANALKELESTGVVPKVYAVYKKNKLLPFGSLIMEYLIGCPLNYKTDLEVGAELLAKIHSHKIKNNFLLRAEKPFQTMHDECTKMFSVYQNWKDKNSKSEKIILELLKIAKDSGLNSDIENECIISTELNNQNFIIGDNVQNSFVIDWEKPIIGEKEQDLAHFLVPTTTNWKTDVILTQDEINFFLNEYEKFLKVDRVKLKKYLMFNCLRGITWSAMANVEYSGERTLKDKTTEAKIKKFISLEFLNYIKENFFYNNF